MMIFTGNGETKAVAYGTSGPTVMVGQHEVSFARLATLKAGLKLEIKGMKRHGRSAFAILRDMGYRGTRATVLAKVEADIEAAIAARNTATQEEV